MNIYILYSVEIFIAIIGVSLKIWTPNRNSSLGYRTSFALKNNQTWETSNKYFGILLSISSIISIITTFITSNILFFNIEKVIKISSITLIVLIFISLILTEIYLKIKFDKDGYSRK